MKKNNIASTIAMQFAIHSNAPEMEVLHIYILVRGCLTLAPQQQTFFGGHLFHGNVLDGEPQDDRPDHTQSHF